MSPVSQLLKELRRVGVEHRPLSEIGTLYGGLTGKTKKDFGVGDARYVPYTNIFANSRTDMDALENVVVGPGERHNLVKRGDVLFTGSSETLDEVGMTSVVASEPAGPLYLNSFSIGLRWLHDELVLPGYASHLFRSTPLRKQIVATANGATRFNLSRKALQSVRVPLPSLEAQRQIADVLDTMEQLGTELQAEREARMRQFAHYRSTLLTFERGGEVDWLPLGDLLREPLANGRSTPSGSGYPVLRLTALRGSVVDVTQHKLGSWTAEAGRRFRIEEGDILVVRGNGSKDLIARASMVDKTEEVAFPDTAIRVRPNLDIISQRYLYYIWESPASRVQLQQAAKMTSGVWKVSQSDLAGVVLPVPSPAEQARIVSILDEFDALVNDVASGVPAEIAARRKQYEHYRDLLLTFPEKATA